MSNPILLAKMLVGNVLSILPSFPLFLLMGVGGFLFFTGLGLLWSIRRPLTPLFLSISGIFGIVTYIVVINYLIPYFNRPLAFIESVTIVFVLLSLIQLWWRRAEILLILRKTDRLWWVLGVSSVIVLSLMLHNLTYQNGLHDEYFHHAVITHFFRTPSWPLPDPFRENIYVNEYYHHGWYLIVIALASLSKYSVELSLDFTKSIVLIASIIPSLTLLWSFAHVRSKVLTTFFVIAIYTSGPALFFFDTFTANVFFGGSFIQAFTPLLYELAGLSWHGFTVVSLLILYMFYQIRQKDRRILVSFILLALSTSLINRAMVPVVIVNFIIFVLLISWKQKWKCIVLNMLFLAYCLILLMSTSLITILNGLQTSELNANSLEHSHAAKGLLRAPKDIGLIVLKQEKTEIIPFGTKLFWQTSGFFWIVSLGLLVEYFSEKKDLFHLIGFINILLGIVLGMMIWFMSIDVSLTLNKYYKLIMFWSIVNVNVFYSNGNKAAKWAIFLLLSGCIAPIFYLLAGNFKMN